MTVQQVEAIISTIFRLIEKFLPLVPSRYQVKVLDDLIDWAERRRAIIQGHQQRLARRKKTKRTAKK